MTPPWMRLLDPSDRLTLAYNDYLRMDDAQMGAQRRPRRSVTPPSPPQLSVSAPAATTPAPPVALNSRSIGAGQPPSARPSDSFEMVAYGIRVPVPGFLNLTDTISPYFRRFLFGPQEPRLQVADVNLMTQFRVGSLHFQTGLRYANLVNPALNEVVAYSPAASPVSLHEFGATVGLLDDSWEPSAAANPNRQSNFYFDRGGPTSTWIRASVLSFEGGNPSDSHSPIFQLGLGHLSPLFTFGGGAFEGRCNILPTEFLFSFGGANIDAPMTPASASRTESDLLPRIQTGAFSCEAWFLPNGGRLGRPRRPAMMSNAEFYESLLGDAFDFTSAALRAEIVNDGIPAMGALVTSPTNDRRTVTDVSSLFTFPLLEITAQSSVMAGTLGVWAGRTAGRWNRMQPTHRVVSTAQSILLGSLGLGGLLFSSSGSNVLRTMAPSLITSQAYQWLRRNLYHIEERFLPTFFDIGLGVLASVGILFSTNLAGQTRSPRCAETPFFPGGVPALCAGALAGQRGYDAERDGFNEIAYRTVDIHTASVAALSALVTVALGPSLVPSENNTSRANPPTAQTTSAQAFRDGFPPLRVWTNPYRPILRSVRFTALPDNGLALFLTGDL